MRIKISVLFALVMFLFSCQEVLSPNQIAPQGDIDLSKAEGIKDIPGLQIKP